ncbi:MAG: hypothetical protein JXX14_24255 [Deltaproteobacteria bacterium]|nr:hypothetical protein [Deltaproteobacteria bacterium]
MPSREIEIKLMIKEYIAVSTAVSLPSEVREIAKDILDIIYSAPPQETIVEHAESFEKRAKSIKQLQERSDVDMAVYRILRQAYATMAALSRQRPHYDICFPSKIKKVIARLPNGETIEGELTSPVGTSLYNFHYEYPVNGEGIRKDCIFVVNEDCSETAIIQWCRENRIRVRCNRCGQDITETIDLDCPHITRN